MAIRSFTELNAWREGHKLVLKIYSLTKSFPREEMYGLSDQLRRAAVSVTSGIAEGFSRNTAKDKNQFYYIALGSLTEIQNQLMVARDLEYLAKEQFIMVAELTVVVHKLINGLLKTSVTKIRNT